MHVSRAHNAMQAKAPETVETEDLVPKRHTRFYFADGNIIFLVSDTHPRRVVLTCVLMLG